MTRVVSVGLILLFGLQVPPTINAQAKSQEKTAHDLIGIWSVTSQEYPDPWGKIGTLGGIARIKFTESTCTVAVFDGADKAKAQDVAWKFKTTKNSDALELQLVNDNDIVKVRALCKWSESGELMIAIGVDDKDFPKGFDPNKHKVCLLSLKREK